MYKRKLEEKIDFVNDKAILQTNLLGYLFIYLLTKKPKKDKFYFSENQKKDK